MNPVVMFHSVGLEKSNWATNFLSVPVRHMEALLRFLCENKYEALFLDDWYRLQDQPAEERVKRIYLTFDDGYLDNWINLFPLLEKYGIRATVFVNPEFVDPSQSLRPNLKDVWKGRAKKGELADRGYLNWPEIRAMQTSGLVDIQSHSMSHNRYFASERIIEFYFPPAEKLHWLAWLEKPERKPFWMVEDQQGFTRSGTPVFESGRSLGVRRYFPDPGLIDFSLDRFAKDPQLSKEAAIKECSEFMSGKGALGRMETDAEMIRRYRYELKESKEILENKLNKNVDFLCWPGGAYNDLSVAISRQVGYKASTVSSRERYLPPGDSGKYKRISRCGLGSSFTTRGKTFISDSPQTLVRSFLELEGKWYWKYPRRAKKLYYMIFK